MPVRTTVRRGPTKIERYTIWDNLERHEQELRAIGATDADLAPLREAAKVVDAAETTAAKADGANPAFDKDSLADLTGPYRCANGWLIRPPSIVARRWAAAAVIKVTGGQEPRDRFGLAYCVLAGLFILKAWGEDRCDDVMRLVTAPNELANLLPRLEDEVGAANIQEMAEDYSLLMGGKKKDWQRIQYQRLQASLRSKLSAARTSGSSASSSSPTGSSASTGAPTRRSRPNSSTPSPGNTTASRRSP